MRSPSTSLGENLVSVRPAIAPMSPQAIDKVRRLERQRAALPQVSLRTDHLFHAGMYARTIRIPAGVVITGALIKVATLLIVQGEARIYAEGGTFDVAGYNVVPAAAGRKQAILAESAVSLTMIFPTAARTVAEAEAEFTNEAELLGSRREDA
jgi:hypothetical protein